jgi:hypothetical protein
VLELSFADNPFFTSSVLRKSYKYAQLPAGAIAILASEAEPVAWREGQDLTVRAGPGGKPRPAASLFCLFKKGAARRAFNIAGAPCAAREGVGVRGLAGRAAQAGGRAGNA